MTAPANSTEIAIVRCHTKTLLAVLLAAVCIVGDQLVASSRGARLVAALCDNLTHGSVALICTLLVTLEFGQRLTPTEQRLQLIGGFVCASLMDVDHFVEAHSLQLAVGCLAVQIGLI